MKKTDPETAAYYAEGRSWEADRTIWQQWKANVGLAIGAGGFIIAAVAVAAVYRLTPLKQLVPITIRYNETTARVSVDSADDGPARNEWRQTFLLLSAYVISRERFVLGVVEDDYWQVASMNSGPMNAQWDALWDDKNPQSPINVYKDGTTVKASISSGPTKVKLAGGKDSLAQVRFRKITRLRGSGPEIVTNWIATIEYTYAPPKKGEEVDPRNPLGFRVMEYQRQAETVAPDGTAVAENGAAR